MLLAFAALSFARLSSASHCSNATAVINSQNLNGTFVVITGGDSGIGLAAARALAGANATVLIAAYHLAHGQAVANNISAQTGNANVAARQIDLSNLTSVRAFADGVLASTDKIDVLVDDAGIACPIDGMKGITDDGFERVFQTNYLGHFLLTEMLLPALRLSSQGRVISMSSFASVSPCLLARRASTCLSDNVNWQQDATTMTPNVTISKGLTATNYGISKFMQMAHMYELAKRERARGSNVRAYSMHPGVVATAMTKGKLTNETCVAVCLADMGKIVDRCRPGICPVFPRQAAATLAFLSTEATDKLVDGEYYFECAVARKPTPRGWSWDRDPELLYNTSLSWSTNTDIRLNHISSN